MKIHCFLRASLLAVLRSIVSAQDENTSSSVNCTTKDTSSSAVTTSMPNGSSIGNWTRPSSFSNANSSIEDTNTESASILGVSSATNFNSTSTSSPAATSSASQCQQSGTVVSDISYPFILHPLYAGPNTSITLDSVDATQLGSIFKTASGSSIVPAQGVFTLHNGTLLGGYNGEPHQAGICSIVSEGYGITVYQFPSCAVGGMASQTDLDDVKTVGTQWVAKAICLDDKDRLVLVPDLYQNGTADEKYFQAWPKDGSICCNSQQSDDNNTQYLVVREVVTTDLNDPYSLYPMQPLVD